MTLTFFNANDTLCASPNQEGSVKRVWGYWILATLMSTVLVAATVYTVILPMAFDWANKKDAEIVFTSLVNYPEDPGDLLRKQLLRDGLEQKWTFEVISHRMLADDDGHAILVVADAKRQGHGKMRVVFADTLVWSSDPIPLHIALFRVGAMYTEWTNGHMKSFERIALGDTSPTVKADACEELFHAARVMARAQCYIELRFRYSLTHGALVDEPALLAHEQGCRESLQTLQGADAFRDHLVDSDSYPACSEAFRNYDLKTPDQRAST